MEAGSVADRGPSRPGVWRLWALVPILLLVGVVALFASTGASVLDLVGQAPPPADRFDVRRVEFRPGEIRIRVTNPQREKLTIATVTVDDAVFPFRVDGPSTLDRLRSSVIGVDEVAFQVRRQHTRRRGRPNGRRYPHACEECLQLLRRTRDRGWTERRHPVTRKFLRDGGDGGRAIEYIDPFESVNMDIDESRNDQVPPQIDAERTARPIDDLGLDRHDPIGVEHQASTQLDTIRQDQVRAGEDDHA